MKTLRIKKQLGVLAFFLALLLLSIQPTKAASKSYHGVTFQVFYDELSPFGDWVKDARYGYIWLPAVYDDFHPYGTNGYWVMTEFGNTWVSDYDWGWATFHYGRWYFDDYYQSWAWIPGYEWAPAWVSWRSGGGFYGWAPLGPGLSVNVLMNIPSRHWVFIPYGRIYHRNLNRFYSPFAYHHTKIKLINRTTVINTTVVYANYNYYSGPSHRELERVTRQVVPVYALRSSQAPGREAISRNEVRMYRPEIDQSRGRTLEARPSRVLESKEAVSSRPSRTVSSSGVGNGNQPSRPSVVQNSSSERATNPSASRGNDGFELRPVPSENRGRTVTAEPTRSAKPSPQESTRTNQPIPSRESRVSNQSSPRQQTEQRNSTSPRSSEVRTQPAPQVRTAPARGSEDGKVSSPSRKVEESRGQTSSPSGFSPSGRTESSPPSRGNSRERSNY
jgi:hypothetical protein